MSRNELKSIKCAKVEKIGGKNVYLLAITWSDVHFEYVGRTLLELLEFRQSINLKALINDDSSKTSVAIPELQVKEKQNFFAANKSEKNKKAVDDFFQHFLKLPSSILKNPDVIKFFSHGSASTEEGVIELIKKGDKSDKSTRRPSTATVNNNNTDYEEISNEPSKRPESKKPEVPDAGYAEYAEVSVVPAASSTAEDKKQQSSSLENESSTDPELLYASICKTGRPLIIRSLSDELDQERYADTSAITTSQNEQKEKQIDYLYAEIGQEAANSKPAPNPRTSPDLPPSPNHTKPTQLAVNSVTKPAHTAPTKPVQPAPIKPAPLVKPILPSTNSEDIPETPSRVAAPLTPVPPMPQFPPPTLDTTNIFDTSSSSSDPENIQVIALADYKSSTDNVLSFTKGTPATLILQSDSKWWCIRMGSTNGWVPADYWKMLSEGDCTVLTTKSGVPWFVGKLSRAECVTELLTHGKQQDFVVRESDKLYHACVMLHSETKYFHIGKGHYALSVKYNNQVHHFPIQLTEDKKYNIGKHDFKSVYNVITYYKKNALFYDEKNVGVLLGSPLVILKQ